MPIFCMENEAVDDLVEINLVKSFIIDCFKSISAVYYN